MTMIEQGRIIKNMAGIYTVQTNSGKYPCKARGALRRNSLPPLVGDNVQIEHTGGSSVIFNVDTRKNFLIRPPVANIDHLFFIVSAAQPDPNLYVLDKLLTIAEFYHIQAKIVVTKIDLSGYGQLEEVYSKAGYPLYPVCSETGEGVEAVKQLLKDTINVFLGNTGVGKSTLLNAIEPSLHLPTGEISLKLGRGKHTTRHVELYPLVQGGYLADTPGFSTVDILAYGIRDKLQLASCFPEFVPYIQRCRFKDCSHTCEKGCGVLEAIQDGVIHPLRHKSYVALYNEIKDIKPWEKKI